MLVSLHVVGIIEPIYMILCLVLTAQGVFEAEMRLLQLLLGVAINSDKKESKFTMCPSFCMHY